MPSVGSLFSGVGGFDLGFEQAGFEVAWQVEIDRDAVSVLERHWPDVPRYGDIATVDPAELAPVDVVIFGSPCQDFSVAGKRAGLDGARSGLFGEAIRIIRGLRPAPALVCWENVPGTLSSAGGRDFGAVLDALAGAGALDIAWRILDARWFGVPQRRRRLFVVSDLRAERAAEVLFEPQGSSGHPAESRAARQGAARDAADGAGVATFDERNVTSRANRTRVEYGAPANTLHADGLSVITPMAVRRLTPTECCRLMGWSDDWVTYRADGSEIPDGPRYRMIGNGVVAPVARWIAERMLAVLEA